MSSLLNWIKPSLNFWINFLIEFFGEKGYWIIFEVNISKKMILNNHLNWILLWNEWMNYILNWYLPFFMNSPLFNLFWTLFRQFLGTFPIGPVSMIPLLLNWIFFWIESAYFFNWIIVWIEFWINNIESNTELNHFSAKNKHWIDSDRVLPTPTTPQIDYILI